MLRAYSKMPADEFIAQLRVYVIAMGLSPQVVDCVDNLRGGDDIEYAHTAEVEDAGEDGEKRGRESMKEEMVAAVTNWIENHPAYEMVKGPCEAILKLLESIKT